MYIYIYDICLYFVTLCILLIGASFAEALGMCTVAPSLRKRHNNSPNLSSAKVIKLEANISSTLNNKKQSSVKNEPTSSDSLHVSYFDIQ